MFIKSIFIYNACYNCDFGCEVNEYDVINTYYPGIEKGYTLFGTRRKYMP